MPVAPRPEPADFDGKVRRKGLAWMKRRKIDTSRPLPKGEGLRDYWRDCLDDMYVSYGQCCAYLAVFLHNIGEVSIDHFEPKSKRPDLAYEWSNYRLACALMNVRKKDHEDVLDPFVVQNGWFRLEPVTGHIFPNPDVDEALQEKIRATIKRLGLDDAQCRKIRTRHFQEYCEGRISGDYLKTHSPFVWFEANRQDLL